MQIYYIYYWLLSRAVCSDNLRRLGKILSFHTLKISYFYTLKISSFYTIKISSFYNLKKSHLSTL